MRGAVMVSKAADAAVEFVEACPCGGSFTVKAAEGVARDALKEWRVRHPKTHVAVFQQGGATSGDISLKASEGLGVRLS